MEKKITIKEMDEQDFRTQIFQAYNEMGYDKSHITPEKVPVFIEKLIRVLFYSLDGCHDENK